MREGRTRAAAFAHALLLFALCLALSGCAIELPYHSGEDFGIPTAVSPVDFDGDGTILGCRDASQMINLTRELLRRGYDTASIRKIWGENWLRVMAVVQNNV